jgi:lipopolysaccharide/colanic/teichoic acid biosynthesis glycosyltransferase
VIKLLSRGPVLFKHKRYGLEGEPFYVWKFRTMQQSVDPAEHRQHLTELMSGQQSLKKLPSRRLIPLGGWLRSSAIDELPQLVNILRGEMSLVGPRPDVVPLHEYEPWQRVRFRVLPGMTGLWQVSGKNNTTFDEMVRLDARYVEKCSLLFDLRIILLTLPAILAIILEELTSIQE